MVVGPARCESGQVAHSLTARKVCKEWDVVTDRLFIERENCMTGDLKVALNFEQSVLF
jgi:hypothetical protein